MDSVYTSLKTQAQGNVANPPDGFPENMQASDLNDTFRELMSLLARYNEEQSGAGLGVGAASDIRFSFRQTLDEDDFRQGVQISFRSNATTAINAVQLFRTGTTETRPVVTDSGGRIFAKDFPDDGMFKFVYRDDLAAWQLLSEAGRQRGRSYRSATTDAVVLTRVDLGGLVDVNNGGDDVSFSLSSDLAENWPAGAFVEFADVRTVGGAGCVIVLPEGANYQRLVPVRGVGTNIDTPFDTEKNAATLITRGNGKRTGRLFRLNETDWRFLQGPG